MPASGADAKLQINSGVGISAFGSNQKLRLRRWPNPATARRVQRRFPVLSCGSLPTLLLMRSCNRDARKSTGSEHLLHCFLLNLRKSRCNSPGPQQSDKCIGDARIWIPLLMSYSRSCDLYNAAVWMQRNFSAFIRPHVQILNVRRSSIYSTDPKVTGVERNPALTRQKRG